jgi:hypothetical protein
MQDWSFNCNKFNPKRLYKLRLTPALFQEIVKGHGLKAIKQRKLYPQDHKEIHHVGERPLPQENSSPETQEVARSDGGVDTH